ncbi:MAG: hypothetical protein AB1758_01010 [Candidatus Eremiobacterota bacterium]
MEYRLGPGADFQPVPVCQGRRLLALQASGQQVRSVEVRVPAHAPPDALGDAPWLQIRGSEGGEDYHTFLVLVNPSEAGSPGDYLTTIQLAGQNLGVLLRVSALAAEPPPPVPQPHRVGVESRLTMSLWSLAKMSPARAWGLVALCVLAGYGVFRVALWVRDNPGATRVPMVTMSATPTRPAPGPSRTSTPLVSYVGTLVGIEPGGVNSYFLRVMEDDGTERHFMVAGSSGASWPAREVPDDLANRLGSRIEVESYQEVPDNVCRVRLLAAPPAPPSPSGPDLTDPEQMLRHYYQLIEEDRFEEAHALRSRRSRGETGLEEFRRIWSNNHRVWIDRFSLQWRSGDRAEAYQRLASDDTNPATGRRATDAYVGTVKLRFEDGAWRYDGYDFKPE